MFHHSIYYQTVSVWDWTINGDMPMCSVVLDDNFGKQVGYEHLKVNKQEHSLGMGGPGTPPPPLQWDDFFF